MGTDTCPARAEREHRAHLTGGAARDVEECEQLVGRAALEALGDVVGDGERGALQLIAEGVPQPRRRTIDEIVDAIVEFRGGLPDREVLETLIGGHGVFGDEVSISGVSFGTGAKIRELESEI